MSIGDIAASLGLSSDAAPLQIANEALILLGVKQGNLTPVSAFDVGLADWHGHLRRGDHIIVRDNSRDPIEHHAIFCGRRGDSGPIMIADMWGEDKESARIRLRPFGDLLKGRSQLLVREVQSGRVQSCLARTQLCVRDGLGGLRWRPRGIQRPEQELRPLRHVLQDFQVGPLRTRERKDQARAV